MVSSSTYYEQIREEHRRASSGDMSYNADMPPIQHPILANNWTNILNPVHREQILEYSTYLRRHTIGIVQQIVARGWTLKKRENETSDTSRVREDSPRQIESQSQEEEPKQPEENEKEQSEQPEWSDELKNKFIDVCAMSAAVDTAFLLRLKEPDSGRDTLKVMSRNYVEPKEVIGNRDRKIKKVTINFPKLDDLYKENGDHFTKEPVKFNTQYATEEQIKKDKDKLGRHCVVVTLQEHPDSAFGKPYAIREIQTALEKLHIRFYETLTLHKGGILHEFVTLPNLKDKDVAIGAKKDIRRGILSRGGVIEIPNMSDASKQFTHSVVEMGKMDFSTISSHVNEDSPLTKQSIEGEAASGALGGAAPIVNQKTDEDYVTEWQDLIEPVIKDINFVFFDLNPNEWEVEFSKPLNEISEPQAEKDDNPDPQLEQKRMVDRTTKQFKRRFGEE